MIAGLGKRCSAVDAQPRVAGARQAWAGWCGQAVGQALAAAALILGFAGCGVDDSARQAVPPPAAAAGGGAGAVPELSAADPPLVAEWIAEGQRMADELAEAFPNQPHALDLAARFHQRAGDPRKAAPLWQRYLALEPGSAYACFCLGSAAWERGEFDQAAEYLRKALALDPALPNAPVVLGESLMQLGQPAEALSVLEKADRATPQSMRWFLMGQACLQLGRFAQARDHLEKAVALEPQFAKAHYALVTAYMRLGDVAKAEEHRAQFLKYLREEAGEPGPARTTGRDLEADEVRRLLAELAAGGARCYALAGQVEPAQRWLARARELDPQNPACARAAEALRSAAAGVGRTSVP